MRLFLAIELDTAVKKSIELIQKKLKETGADVGWVKPQNIHLTLKFLGETGVEKIDPIKKTMEACAQVFSAFILTIHGAGYFPEHGQMRIVWLSLEEGKNESTRIAQELENKMAEIGFKKEDREFSAHITIGRVRSEGNLFALKKKLKSFQDFKIPIAQTVTHITLFKSTLTPQGPAYEALETFSLKP